MGGGVSGLGNLGRGRGLEVQEIWEKGGVKNSCHPSGGGGDFFWNNPIASIAGFNGEGTFKGEQESGRKNGGISHTPIFLPLSCSPYPLPFYSCYVCRLSGRIKKMQ